MSEDSRRMPVQRAQVAIVGGGIVGLAHAWMAARAGRSVVVLERGEQARGASVRNFGLIWPIGQPAGAMHDLALRSRELWIEFLAAARLPHLATGSLHVAFEADEEAVGREFAAIGPSLGYDCRWLDPAAVTALSPAVRPAGLRGGLHSPLEVTVDPRLVLGALPRFLHERYGVELRFGRAVTRIELPVIDAGGERWEVEHAIVCGGDDFTTLYPALFAGSGIRRCKLQMMRTAPQPDGWQLGPALAGGLTLRFYAAFEICTTLARLKQRIALELPEYERWGIHVMASQTPSGEVTIGDSHEYGLSVDPFDKPEIDALVTRYFDGFARLPHSAIVSRWHGVYAKHPELPYFTAAPEPGVRIVTATGGAGMTLSFGIAERTWRELAS